MTRDNLTVRQCTAFQDFQLETGKPLDVCIVQNCWKKTRCGKTVCCAHRQQKWRCKHPEAAQYHRLRGEAKKRKKVFTITRKEWMELCRLTNYHRGTAGQVGSVREGLTIDRIRHEGGYTLDNVRVIVNHENSRKGSYEMKCRLSSDQHVLLRANCVSIAEQLIKEADALEELETILERI